MQQTTDHNTGASHSRITMRWLSCPELAWFWFIEDGVEELIEASGFGGYLVVDSCCAGSVYVVIMVEKSICKAG